MSSAPASSAVASSAAAAASSVAAASTSAAAAATSTNAPASSAAASIAPAASSVAASAPAVSGASRSTSATPSSASASASAPAASTSAIVSSAAASSSATSSSASASRSIARASASAAAASGGSTGLSGGAIGGIVGGAVGGILVLGLIWFFWRRRRDKKDWVPPPPPREMSYNTATGPRQRAVSNTMLAGGMGDNRASSYSTLLYPRPSSTYNSHSRQPSYYANYPVATPSSQSHEAASPPLHGVNPSGISSTESSPPISGLNTPAVKPALAPIDTSLQRDSSGSSDGRPVPRNKSSVDRLRQEAQAGPSRAPSFSSGHGRNLSDAGSSRATSPHPSMYGGGAPRHSYSSSLTAPNPQNRPYSTYSSHSLSGARMGGAPHQRHVQVEMPRLLGARPDSNGDFFAGMPRSQESMHWGGSMDGFDRSKRISRPELNDFGPPSPVHVRGPSNLSTSAVRRGNYDDRPQVSGEV